jgi:neutral ceramidase
MDELKAGTARLEITPREPIAMGGYGQRTGRNRGVHDPLYAGALFLSFGKESLLFITSDLVCIPDGLANEAASLIERRTGLTGAQICITASHTHSGPELMEYFAPTEAVVRYRGFLTQALADLAAFAVESAFPAEAAAAEGRIDFQLNRRTGGSPNRVDDRIFALAVRERDSRRVRAILYGCGCHPVCLGHDNSLISADYPGFARRDIEKSFPGANALFFNMAEGNVIPATRPPADSLDTRGYRGGAFSDAEKIGSLLAAAVLQSLKDARFQENLELGARLGRISIQPNNFDLNPEQAREGLINNQAVIASYLGDSFTRFTPTDLTPLATLWADASRLVEERNLPEEEMRRLMSAVCRYFVLLNCIFNPAMHQPAVVPVQLIKLGDYSILALPGEVLAEAAMEWQESAGSTAYIAGLANGYLGYLPHGSNFHEPGWEDKYETIMSALEPGAMELILAEAKRLLTLLA